MKLTQKLALPLAALAVIGAGLSIGAALPGPADTAPVCEEDQSCWDCTTMGNRICGPVTDRDRATAWDVWDYSGGPHSLKVDPSRPYRVEYLGWAVTAPKLDEGALALVGKDGKWYVFTAAYTD